MMYNTSNTLTSQISNCATSSFWEVYREIEREKKIAYLIVHLFSFVFLESDKKKITQMNCMYTFKQYH